jgi:hypothetical protein
VATAKSLSNISSHASLVQILHSKGINLRLIGKMIPHAIDKAARVFLIEEMISRIIKHHIRDRYQTEMEEKLLVFQESFRKISCDVLNRLLDPNNDLWIFVKKEAKQRYEFDLTQDDLSIISVYSIIKVSLFFSLSFLFLLLILKLISLPLSFPLTQRVFEIQGIIASSSLMDDLSKKNVKSISLSDVEINPHNKRMNIVVDVDVAYKISQLKGKSVHQVRKHTTPQNPKNTTI